MFRVGLVGLGAISRFYLAAIEKSSRALLRAVCDVDEGKLAPFAGKGVLKTIDSSRLCSSPDVDAVIVNVPNDMHYRICAEALHHGKHVCCEKPLTLRLEEAERLQTLASERGRVIFTAFHRRYNRNVLRVVRGLRNRAPIRAVRIRYLEDIREHCGDDAWYLEPSRCGGGAIVDNGPNALDLVRLVLGRIDLVEAEVSRSSAGVDMRATLRAVAPGGATAMVELDWVYRHGEMKDVLAVYKDGTSDLVDMLDGFTAFKSSLYHEYEGVFEDFISRSADPVDPAHDGDAGPNGFEMVRLVENAYRIARSIP
jgi:predicted dehydrogenase